MCSKFKFNLGENLDNKNYLFVSHEIVSEKHENFVKMYKKNSKKKLV